MKFATPKSDKWRVASGGKKSRPGTRISRHPSRVTGHASAFTLAEVLAALMFMAIVIPVAVEALHTASLAGVVAVRKGAATRVADRVLNGPLVMTNWDHGTQTGTIMEGPLEFRWTLTSQTWLQEQMQLLTAEVKFSAQGKDYSVKLSTVADTAASRSSSGL